MQNRDEDLKILKRKLLTIAFNKQVSHIGSSLSALEILYNIYQNNDHDKIRVILSKGHAALCLYVILNKYGYISDELLETYCDEGSKLYGHVSLNPELRVDCTAGSLGHGASIAIGYAIAEPQKTVFCIVGDGEQQEGSFKEALQFAKSRNFKNLKIIVDSNGYQGYDKTELIAPSDIEEWEGFEVVKTLKGGGLSIFENLDLESHYRKLTSAQFEKAIKELL